LSKQNGFAGFIDAHIHLHGFAERWVTLNLSPRIMSALSLTFEKELATYQKTYHRGLDTGVGYNEFYLDGKRHPTRWDLDIATSAHPIKLTHRSGRAHVLNSLALKLVHISKETADPKRALSIGIWKQENQRDCFLDGDTLGQSIPPLITIKWSKG